MSRHSTVSRAWERCVALLLILNPEIGKQITLMAKRCIFSSYSRHARQLLSRDLLFTLMTIVWLARLSLWRCLLPFVCTRSVRSALDGNSRINLSKSAGLRLGYMGSKQHFTCIQFPKSVFIAKALP